MLVPNTNERRGYVDTPAGQVHYRESGNGEAIVLLHWTPGTSHQYAAVLPALGAAGYRALAPDLPGFGLSCRREGHWSIGDFADNLLACLDSWQLENAVFWAGHMAAEIALEAALRSPARCSLLVLDGVPTWDEDLRRDILDKARPDAPQLREDGAHLEQLWQHLLSELRLWRPQAEFDEALGQQAMRLLLSRMLAEFDWRPARALLAYDSQQALRQLRTPLLALTAEQDPLRACHAAVLACVAGAGEHIFAGGHPVHEPARVAEYIAPVLDRLALESGPLRSPARPDSR